MYFFLCFLLELPKNFIMNDIVGPETDVAMLNIEHYVDSKTLFNPMFSLFSLKWL